MIDNVDLAILGCMKENSRQNISEISKRVSLSISAVSERIKKMESAGIIKQYSVILDNKKIGKDIIAFTEVSIEHPKFNNSFSAAARKNKHIAECHYITGDFDFLLKIITNSTHSLEQVLNSIKSIEGVSLTRTLVVLSTVKSDSAVIPE